MLMVQARHTSLLVGQSSYKRWRCVLCSPKYCCIAASKCFLPRLLYRFILMLFSRVTELVIFISAFVFLILHRINFPFLLQLNGPRSESCVLRKAGFASHAAEFLRWLTAVSSLNDQNVQVCRSSTEELPSSSIFSITQVWEYSG